MTGRGRGRIVSIDRPQFAPYPPIIASSDSIV